MGDNDDLTPDWTSDPPDDTPHKPNGYTQKDLDISGNLDRVSDDKIAAVTMFTQEDDKPCIHTAEHHSVETWDDSNHMRPRKC